MKKLHKLMVLSGTEDFLKDREKKRLIQAAWANGYRVLQQYDNTGNQGQKAIDDELSQLSVIAIEPILVVTENWQPQIDISEDHKDDSHISYLCLFEETPKDFWPQIAKVSTYNRGSTRRERKQAAEKFCAAEAKRQGIEIAEDMCTAIVEVTGDDLGIVSWELYKISALARAKGIKTISNDLLSQTLRLATNSPDLQQFVEAMSQLDTKRVAKIFNRYRHGDHTMLLLRSKGGPVDTAISWLRILEVVSDTNNANNDLDYVSTMVGIPTWQLKNRDMQAAKRWGESRLRGLLKGITELERSIVEGRCHNPWLACQSIFLQSLKV
jgi:DNA polymerase III delta subunit